MYEPASSFWWIQGVLHEVHEERQLVQGLVSRLCSPTADTHHERRAPTAFLNRALALCLVHHHQYGLANHTAQTEGHERE